MQLVFIGLQTKGEGTNGEGRLKDERSGDNWVKNISEEGEWAEMRLLIFVCLSVLFLSCNTLSQAAHFFVKPKH